MTTVFATREYAEAYYSSVDLMAVTGAANAFQPCLQQGVGASNACQQQMLSGIESGYSQTLSGIWWPIIPTDPVPAAPDPIAVRKAYRTEQGLDSPTVIGDEDSAIMGRISRRAGV